jgi:glyoxylase-like metal-dependent hydrolase (beta-lactamase superfamily II)/rhodanese-related sulfurtransferase
VKFVQYYLDCLSQASYLIGDETTGRAAVVDPRRDIQEYLDDAAAGGLSIDYVIETHVHADFLSGHLELAAATGATIVYGEAADLHFPHRKVADGERIELGQVTLEFRATPGHTPESICVVVRESPGADAPFGVLTGDTLFIGDVGRPDLLSAQGQSPEDMARALYRSLHTSLLTLPDATRVYPAHGAGSACGKNLSTEKTSTIGEQRRSNYALRLATEGEFVAAVTEGQPPAPGYFARVAELNRESHELAHVEEPPLLPVGEVLRLQAGGAAVLDVRSPEEFARGHLRGSVNVGLDGRFAEYAAQVVGGDIVVVCDPGRARDARMRLARVGLDSVVGALEAPEAAFVEHPEVTGTASRLTARQLADARAAVPDLVLLDVRGPGERDQGYVEGSAHIPLGQLRDRIGELEPARPVVIYCAGGYRSSIAASLLRSSGFADVSDLIGGYQGWLAAA